MNDESRACKVINCYGLVKEYTPDGPRDPPEEVQNKRSSMSRKIKRLVLKLFGRELEQITWYECSVCHEYHEELTK